MVPRKAIRAALLSLMKKGEVSRIEKMGKAVAGPFFHICSPPPRLRDADVLRTKTTGDLINRMWTQGLNPPDLRMSIWLAQQEVLEEAFVSLGGALLMPPAPTVEEGGFLARDYQGDDATHANIRYGALMLEQVIATARTSFDPPASSG